MNYPSLLIPNDIEKIHLNDRTLSIPNAMKKNSPYYFMDWIDDDLVNQKSIEVQETRIREIIESIKTEHKGFSCFWDIMLWDKDNIVFYECKRKNKDKISPTQINWIESALKTGLKETNFVIFEWSL